jgi:hypothetical protein
MRATNTTYSGAKGPFVGGGATLGYGHNEVERRRTQATYTNYQIRTGESVVLKVAPVLVIEGNIDVQSPLGKGKTRPIRVVAVGADQMLIRVSIAEARRVLELKSALVKAPPSRFRPDVDTSPATTAPGHRGVGMAYGSFHMATLPPGFMATFRAHCGPGVSPKGRHGELSKPWRPWRIRTTAGSISTR